ncbi:MAG: dTMP kinase [bacterium]
MSSIATAELRPSELKKRGKFIILEGGEGTGKSSQMKMLKEYYGDRILTTREPGGTPLAEEIRNVILNSEHSGQASAKTQFALLWAGRADHLKNKIIPALESGLHVIADRFDSTTYAYQIHGQEEKELENLFWPTRGLYLNGVEPDLYIYLDVTAEEGLRRKQLQAQNKADEINHFDERQIDFHNRVRIGYDEFFSKVPSAVVNANLAKEEVGKALIEIIDKILNE